MHLRELCYCRTVRAASAPSTGKRMWCCAVTRSEVMKINLNAVPSPSIPRRRSSFLAIRRQHCSSRTCYSKLEHFVFHRRASFLHNKQATAWMRCGPRLASRSMARCILMPPQVGTAWLCLATVAVLFECWQISFSSLDATGPRREWCDVRRRTPARRP